jgi:hypothetical protein
MAFELQIFDDRKLLDFYGSDTFLFLGRCRLLIHANKDRDFWAGMDSMSSEQVLTCTIDQPDLVAFYDREAKTFLNTW